MIPLASIADFARDRDRLIGTATQQREQHEALERAHAVVSPLSRPSKVRCGERARARRRGRIASRRSRTRRSSPNHLGGKLLAFHGGHILQAGRDEGFREIARLLAARGWLDPR
jgi:rRNA processing protein Krr1/Pno1